MKKIVFIFAFTVFTVLFASAQVGIVNNDTTIQQGQEINLHLSGINVTNVNSRIDQFNMAYRRDGEFHRLIPTVVGQDYIFTVTGIVGIFSSRCEFDAFFKHDPNPIEPWCTFDMGEPNLRPNPDVYNPSHYYTINFKARNTTTDFSFGDTKYDDNCGSLDFIVYKKETITDKRILWSTGDTTVTIKVAPNVTTTYYATITDGTNTIRDSVKVYVAQGFQSNVSIGIKDTTTEGNMNIEIPVTTSLLQISDNIISCQFTLNYNQSILQYIDASLAGTLAASGSFVVNSNTPGLLHFSFMSATPLSGTGDVLKLKFKPWALGKSPLTISNFIFNSTSVLKISNGSVSVVDKTPPTASITYSDADGIVKPNDNLMITATFSEPISDSPKPQISLNGAVSLTNTNMTKVSSTVYTYSYLVAKGFGVVNVSLATATDMAGNVITSKPTSGETFNIIPLKYGDIDENGFVQAYDAAVALQYSVGLDPLPTIDPLQWETWRIATANVDNVGSITSNDASLILQYSAQLISSFPAELGLKSNHILSADINLSIENGYVVFKSMGDLFGLNVFVDKNKELLGAPEFMNQTAMAVTNISETNYAIGLASAYPLGKDEDLIKIPIKAMDNEEVIFNVVVNSEKKSYALNLKTHALKLNGEQISIYPNPADNILYIDGLIRTSTITIVDLNGKVMFSKETESANNSVEIGSLLKGFYIVKIKDKSGVILKKFTKQ